MKSGTSIGANYCESQRASSHTHFTSILGICLREADETNYWLELLAESGIVNPELLLSLQSECEEIIRILAASIKKAKSRNEGE